MLILLCLFLLYYVTIFFPSYKNTSGVFTLVLTDAGKHHNPANPFTSLDVSTAANGLGKTKIAS